MLMKTGFESRHPPDGLPLTAAYYLFMSDFDLGSNQQKYRGRTIFLHSKSKVQPPPYSTFTRA